MMKTTLTLLALVMTTAIGVAHAESVTLTWTAPGDDVQVGTAAKYDLRYATVPIDDSNWGNATLITGLPAPAPAGSPESFVVDGLSSGQTYYFAMRTADEVLNWSLISNVAVKTIAAESLAPAEVVDLHGVTSTPTTVTLSWIAPGDDGMVGTASKYDLRCATFPIDESNWDTAEPISMASPQSAGSTESYTCTDLSPATQYYFAIKTADEVPNWSGLSNVAVYSTAEESPDLPPSDITDLSGSRITTSSVTLTWTAPGADGDLGTASQYDLRYSSAPITESNWSAASPMSGLSSPQVAGSAESYDLTGLASGTVYYFAIKTADELPQWSGLSNVVEVQTATGTSYPSEITDLVVTAHSTNSVSLAWTAPGGVDGSGSAVEYDLRFANFEITESNWSSANRVQTLGAPEPAGTAEAFTVYALTPDIRYYFAIKAADQSGNWSAMSNVVSRTTGAESVPPDEVVDLEGVETTDTGVTLAWTAPGDNGAFGTASEYDLRYALDSITEANWNSATILEGVNSPQEAGTPESCYVSGLSPATRYFFALKTADEVPNWSGLSNVISITTLDQNQPPVIITDLAAAEVTPYTVSLTWTAPADDGTGGNASQYDLRYNTVPITDANWSSATLAGGLSAPAAAGSQEAFTVSDLLPATVYYFAIKSADESGLWSGLSNVAGAETDIEIVTGSQPPADVADLVSTGSSATSVSLQWTAPGADGTEGTAAQYDLRFANFPIDETNWSTTNRVVSLGTPKPAGTKEKYTVWGLTPGIQYYFAIKTADELSNWSNMSNVATDTTETGTTPLSVAFSASTTSGDAPLTVSFYSEVTGDPDSWHWDFGDGTWSGLPDPEHIYEAAGSYTVTLTIANSSGSVSETKPDFITVTGSTTAREIHVKAIEARDHQYKKWCRGYADVYVVNAQDQPVSGAQVWLEVSGSTSEDLSTVTDENGIAYFKTHVSKECLTDWCYTVVDIAHPQLVYNSAENEISSTCQSAAVIVARDEFEWEGGELPDEFALEQNYPNPFNPTTEIAFSLPTPSRVTLVVINTLGQEVAVLADGDMAEGRHSVTWDGRTSAGRPVASGLYFYHLQAGEYSASRKMMLLK